MGQSDLPKHETIARHLEELAEQLVIHHFELIAQGEEHLGAIHHTMHRIHTLRAPEQRGGEPLSSLERRLALRELEDQIAALETQSDVHQDACRRMRGTIRRMQEAEADLLFLTEALNRNEPSRPPNR